MSAVPGVSLSLSGTHASTDPGSSCLPCHGGTALQLATLGTLATDRDLSVTLATPSLASMRVASSHRSKWPITLARALCEAMGSHSSSISDSSEHSSSSPLSGGRRSIGHMDNAAISDCAMLLDSGASHAVFADWSDDSNASNDSTSAAIPVGSAATLDDSLPPSSISRVASWESTLCPAERERFRGSPAAVFGHLMSHLNDLIPRQSSNNQLRTPTASTGGRSIYWNEFINRVQLAETPGGVTAAGRACGFSDLHILIGVANAAGFLRVVGQATPSTFLPLDDRCDIASRIQECWTALPLRPRSLGSPQLRSLGAHTYEMEFLGAPSLPEIAFGVVSHLGDILPAGNVTCSGRVVRIQLHDVPSSGLLHLSLATHHGRIVYQGNIAISQVDDTSRRRLFDSLPDEVRFIHSQVAASEALPSHFSAPDPTERTVVVHLFDCPNCQMRQAAALGAFEVLCQTCGHIACSMCVAQGTSGEHDGSPDSFLVSNTAQRPRKRARHRIEQHSTLAAISPVRFANIDAIRPASHAGIMPPLISKGGTNRTLVFYFDEPDLDPDQDGKLPAAHRSLWGDLGSNTEGINRIASICDLHGVADTDKSLFARVAAKLPLAVMGLLDSLLTFSQPPNLAARITAATSQLTASVQASDQMHAAALEGTSALRRNDDLFGLATNAIQYEFAVRNVLAGFVVPRANANKAEMFAALFACARERPIIAFVTPDLPNFNTLSHVLCFISDPGTVEQLTENMRDVPFSHGKLLAQWAASAAQGPLFRDDSKLKSNSVARSAPSTPTAHRSLRRSAAASTRVRGEPRTPQKRTSSRQGSRDGSSSSPWRRPRKGGEPDVDACSFCHHRGARTSVSKHVARRHLVPVIDAAMYRLAKMQPGAKPPVGDRRLRLLAQHLISGSRFSRWEETHGSRVAEGLKFSRSVSLAAGTQYLLVDTPPATLEGVTDDVVKSLVKAWRADNIYGRSCPRTGELTDSDLLEV